MKKQLYAVLLSLMLGLPTIAQADHLHDTLSEETSCEMCSLSSPATPGEDTASTCATQKGEVRQDKPRWLPLETYRLTERRRGPPLLR